MPSKQLQQDIRRFLKRFGVNADQTIQKAVEQALANGTLTRDDAIPVRAHLVLETLDVNLSIDGVLRLEEEDTGQGTAEAPTVG